MDTSHLPAAMQADCEKTGDFAKQVWACRRDGATIESVMQMVTAMKSNNTSILEELVRELYDLPFDSTANIYNIGYGKLYNMLDLTDPDNPIFTMVDSGGVRDFYVPPSGNRADRRKRKALNRKKVKKDAKK